MRTIHPLSKADLLRRLPPPHQCRALRTHAGLTLYDIARPLGVTAQAVAAWEHGTTPSERFIGPYVELLEALAKIAGGEGVVEGGPK